MSYEGIFQSGYPGSYLLVLFIACDFGDCENKKYPPISLQILTRPNGLLIHHKQKQITLIVDYWDTSPVIDQEPITTICDSDP